MLGVSSAGAEAGALPGGILDYFLPHARVSQQAKSVFRPPGLAAPGSGMCAPPRRVLKPCHAHTFVLGLWLHTDCHVGCARWM